MEKPLFELFFKAYKKILAGISDNIISLGVNLFSMVLVERYYGHQGLGVFAYFISVYYTGGIISEFGIPLYLETHYAEFKKKDKELIFLAHCFKTLLATSIICLLFFFITALSDVYFTQINDDVLGYLIIGAAIPFKNLNTLIKSKLQAEGRISFVSKYNIIKKVIFIIILLGLMQPGTPVSMLLISFFLSELFFFIPTIKTIKFFKIILKKVKYFQTLVHAYDYFFYEKALDIFFYIDFFILGLFMSSQELGIYAETGIFIRFFLLFVFSIKPIIQRYFATLFVDKKTLNLEKALYKISGIVFYINSLLCIYLLFYYEDILDYLFLTKGEESMSFMIFIYTLPGLLFFSVAIVFEVYISVSKNSNLLKSIIIKTIILNIILNLYLIPFSGLYGAAVATMLSMAAYFALIMNLLNLNIFKTFGFNYISGVSFMYLFYKFLPVTGMSIVLIPFILGIAYYFSGIFDIKTSKQTT